MFTIIYYYLLFSEKIIAGVNRVVELNKCLVRITYVSCYGDQDGDKPNKKMVMSSNLLYVVHLNVKIST